MKKKRFFLRLLPYKSVPIISYHGIANIPPEKAIFLHYPLDRFIRQMKYLYDGGFNTIHLDDIIKWLKDGQPIKGKPVVISFDDGLLETYTTVFPILLKYNLSATIFIVTKYIGRKITWGQFEPVNYLNWRQCKEMSKYGISFQSHTCTHPDLTTLTRKEAWNELFKSKKIIEDKLAIPVKHLAYPFGRYNGMIIDLAKKAGYNATYAAVRSESENNIYCMERFPIKLGLKTFMFPIETSVWGSWLRRLYHMDF